jgi:ligand-binding sensor domain-containing protein
VDENSPGSTLVNSSPGDRFTSISALDTDSEGRLWITNCGVSTPLHVWNPQNNNWKAYSFSQGEARFPLDVKVAISGDKWLLLKNGDLLVFNHETGEERYLGNAIGEGGLPGSKVTTLVSDKDGLMWAGTDEGVAFFPDPFSIFSGKVDAIRPIFDRRPLLRDQLITSMAVDGGNRKWIGTPNGLWLFDETGEALVNNFTTENSPLPSNYVKNIAIHAISGEVFITTTQGMVSYRGTATTGGEMHQGVKIFPNPVSMSFNGMVGISGLVDDAIVKITTVTGTLIREVRAEGGTITWNVTDYRGERVATGVYLVYSASAGGSETFVGKIAVVN